MVRGILKFNWSRARQQTLINTCHSNTYTTASARINYQSKKDACKATCRSLFRICHLQLLNIMAWRPETVILQVLSHSSSFSGNVTNLMMIWPTLSATFQKYSNNIRIMEHSCRCLRFAVRCVHQQSAPLLQPLVETIVGLYTIHGYSCFVYLGSILVDEYAHDAGCVAGLLNMLQAFSQPTFTLLTQANGFMDHPDTVDDWFRLCTRFLQRAPVPFLHCNALENIIQCGLQACLLDHKDANAAVMKFFQDLLDVGMKHDEAPDFQERKGLVEVILNTHGQSLVNNLITTALFIIPSYMLQEVSDTLRMIMAFDRVKFCGWLENKLKEIPRTNSGGIEAVTTAQIVELHKVITMANRSKEITRALEEFSRYFT